MKQSKLIFLLLLSTLLLLVTACGGAESATAENIAQPTGGEHMDDANDEGDTHDEGDVHDEDDAHNDDEMNMDHAHVEAPEAFTSLSNPFVDDHEALEVGEETYNSLCATCHGPEGQGDGPAAEGLDPKPASLADGTMMGELSDGYLFWRVSKGGQIEPFNSAMPAWENGLTEEQRWQVITFVRSLSGAADAHIEDDDHSEEESQEAHSD